MTSYIPEFLALGVFLWYLSHQAGRLDRLHTRIAISRGTLDANLARRAGVVAELAAQPTLDPATASLLAQAAHGALMTHPEQFAQRVIAENELTSTIFEVFSDASDLAELSTDPVTSQLLSELRKVAKQVQLSRRFHADAVRSCLNIRSQMLVRLFHLSGHAPLPQTFDFDDELPESMAS